MQCKNEDTKMLTILYDYSRGYEYVNTIWIFNVSSLGKQWLFKKHVAWMEEFEMEIFYLSIEDFFKEGRQWILHLIENCLADYQQNVYQYHK